MNYINPNNNLQQKSEVKLCNQHSGMQYSLARRHGYPSQQHQLRLLEHGKVNFEYIGCVNDQDSKDVIKLLKFNHIKWFAKNNCFALGYNKVSNQKRQGHYSIFDMNDWKLHYKKFAVDEAMVGLLNQEYLNKMFGLGSNGGIYSIEKGQEKLEQKPVMDTKIFGVTDGCFSPNHSKICFSSSDKQIYIYDVVSGSKDALAGHGKEVHTCQWNPKYSLIVSGGEDESIRLWDPSKREQLNNVKKHQLGIKRIRWNNEGTHFISTGKDNQTMMFDLRRVEDPILKLPPCTVDTLVWHPRFENVFVIGDQSGSITFWNTMTPQQPIYQIKKPDFLVTDLAIDSSGFYLGVIRGRVSDPRTPQADVTEVFRVK